MKFQPSRRAVLKGAGGVALGLPLLEMTSGKAYAGPDSPKRLVLVTVGHSVTVTKNVDSWLPTGDFANLSPVLQPLMPHRDKLLLLSGIDNRVGAMGVTTSDGHNLNSRTFLTCMPV